MNLYQNEGQAWGLAKRWSCSCGLYSIFLHPESWLVPIHQEEDLYTTGKKKITVGFYLVHPKIKKVGEVLI